MRAGEEREGQQYCNCSPGFEMERHNYREGGRGRLRGWLVVTLKKKKRGKAC